MLNGEKIRSLRQNLHLSLRQVSRITGGQLSASYLSEIENGKITNPSKKVTRALALVLGVKETVLFTYDEYIEGEFNMCIHRQEYQTMNGWVYYCELVAKGIKLTKEELEKIGCTQEERRKCKQMMEYTCGMGIVPEP